MSPAKADLKDPTRIVTISDTMRKPRFPKNILSSRSIVRVFPVRSSEIDSISAVILSGLATCGSIGFIYALWIS